MQRRGIVPADPTVGLRAPAGGSRLPRVLRQDELDSLLDAPPAAIDDDPPHRRLRDDAVVELLYGSGLRVAEVCGLRIGDIDFMRGVIHPSVQHPGVPLKTEASRAALPIPQSLVLVLSAHVGKWSAEGFVLVNEWGDQLAPWTLQRAMRRARAKVSGLPPDFRFHDLRHYLASMLIASGADVKVVQARLRHASAKTTLDTYAHLWPDSDESTRSAIDAVMQTRAEELQSAESL